MYEKWIWEENKCIFFAGIHKCSPPSFCTLLWSRCIQCGFSIHLSPIIFKFLFYCIMTCLSHWVYFGFPLVFLVYSLSQPETFKCAGPLLLHYILRSLCISRCVLCPIIFAIPLVWPWFPCRCSFLFPEVFAFLLQLALPRAYFVVRYTHRQFRNSTGN